jgi:hypothetical protein
MEVNNVQLLFLSNEMMSPHWHRRSNVPLQFVSFAYVEGKMYHHKQRKGTFVVRKNLRSWGNDVVYGALFVLNDAHFYNRLLDSYQACSKSALLRNHSYDYHHRINAMATPIYFNDVEEFQSLRYREGEEVRCQMYVGNSNQPNINHQLQTRSRIVDGVDKQHFKELIREVLT